MANHDKLSEEEEDFVHNLGHLASSTERFAKSHGMTPDQVRQVMEARRQASVDLHTRLLALDEEGIDNGSIHDGDTNKKQIGKLKHEMICRHRHLHFRNPFVCKNCWTHVPICICHLFAQRDKIPLPRGIHRVLVWTHHEEWGRSSNTGSMLPLGFENTSMLMKGLGEHEEVFQREVLESTSNAEDGRRLTPVVLWPGKGLGNNDTTSLTELRQKLQSTSSEEIILLSIEGTWNNARKMVNKLPPHVLRLDIGEEITSFYSDENRATFFCQPDANRAPFPEPISSSPSLLAPLRRQGKGKFGTVTNVSTLEATVIALMALGIDREDGRWILSNAKIKVDRIREYTGKVYARS
jgi:DTW domain-containing protein YfiP